MKKLLLILLIVSPLYFPQTYVDSLSVFNISRIPNLLQTNFEKQLNTFYLNSNINYTGNYGRISLAVHENYHSTFIRTADKNIRDENSLVINGDYELDTLFNFGITATNQILSDDRKIEINQASVSNLIFLTKITPYERILMSPFVGYSNNTQKMETDKGYIYGISGVIDRLILSDLTINSELLFRNEDITPRRNLNRLINIAAMNAFGGVVENNFNIRFSKSRKDFYYDADSVTSASYDIVNNIQSRTESNYMLQNFLTYDNFLDLFLLDITGRIFWKNIERNTRYKNYSQPSNIPFDTEIDELRMEADAGILYISSLHRTSFRFSIGQRDEQNSVIFDPLSPESVYQSRSEQEKKKNNTSTRASVLLSSEIDLSGKDKLSISLLQNKLRYDTPSEENYDDRDEILSIGRVRYSRFLTPFFEFFTAVEGNYSHIVYLFSEQSSNNYENKILKLNTGGSYRGKNFISSNSFEVSANYTIYDFEDLNPSYRSYSFRQLTLSDSSFLNLGRGFGASFNGYLKVSEQGDLKWVSFETRPNRYLEELYLEPKLSFRRGYLTLSGGIRIFLLTTYRYKENIKQLNTRYNSTGPVGEILFNISERLRSRVFAWYEFIKMEDNQRKEQINANLGVQWNF